MTAAAAMGYRGLGSVTSREVARAHWHLVRVINARVVDRVNVRVLS